MSRAARSLRWPTLARRVPGPPPARLRAPLLLTLATLLLILLPALLRQPWWLSLTAALLLGARAVIALRGLRQPSPLLLVLLALGGARLLLGEYGTLAGRDGGVAFLILLIALKTLETARPRDGRLLVLLGAFALVAGFFFSQDVPLFVHAVFSLLALVACLRVWQRGGLDAAWFAQLRQTGLLLLQALPLTLALFVFFPRPGGPLWQMPVTAQAQATSGLSDSVTPGTVSSLAQSDEVAFRASFAGPPPPMNLRYWRGPVLERLSGRTWSPARLPSEQTQIALDPRTRLDYSVTLEPDGTPWALALDAVAPGSALPDSVVQTAGLTLLRRDNGGSRLRLTLASYTGYRYGLSLSPERLALDTALPAGGNPRSRELARSWAALPPPGRVQRALALLGNGQYRYTLQPPTLGSTDWADELLFGTRLGFCEHYASAFAYLMRAAGVPARLVTGYLGGQPNPQAGDRYLIVRQAEAHAWTEVWLAGQGWVRVDPTAVVAPERVQRGLAAALPASELSAVVRGAGLLSALGLRLDALQNSWNEWVIGFDGGKQQRLFDRLGLGEVGGTPSLLLLLALVGLGLLPSLLAGLRRRPDPLHAAYLRRARRLGLPARPSESPDDYLRRVAAARPQAAAGLRQFVSEYQTLRYGPEAAPAQVRAFVRRWRGRDPR